MPIIFSTIPTLIPASRPDQTRVFFQAPDDALLARVTEKVAERMGRHLSYTFHDEAPGGVTPIILEDVGPSAPPVETTVVNYPHAAGVVPGSLLLKEYPSGRTLPDNGRGHLIDQDGRFAATVDYETGTIHQPQALSAAPAGWRELAAKVMDALAEAQDTTNSQYPEHVRCYPSWERHARWLRWHAYMFRSGNPVGNGAGNPDVLAALAASPTAEQQAAPKAAPMSPINRVIAYSAATKLRELGFAWDEEAEAWLNSAAPAQPVAAPAGDWLWVKLMDFCKKRGFAPANFNDLFEIVDAARAAHTPVDSVQEDAALWHWLAEYLVGTRTDLDDEIVASETVNDLRKLVKAAIKQGEKQ